MMLLSIFANTLNEPRFVEIEFHLYIKARVTSRFASVIFLDITEMVKIYGSNDWGQPCPHENKYNKPKPT